MSAPTPYTRADGIKAYSKVGLRLYDPLIMCAVTRYVWGCPPEEFVACYRKHVTDNHADIGVGTGLCLDRCGLIPGGCRIALLDLQPNCLEYAARRLSRYQPEQYVWNAGEPLSAIAPFDSIGLGGILHCLPGEMRQKGTVFDAVASICNQDATIFGYTLVNDAVPQRLRRRFVFRQFHRLRVINCARDSVRSLHQVLASRFSDYSIEQVGCFAFFTAIVPQPTHKFA